MSDIKNKQRRDLFRSRPTKFGKEQFVSDVCNDKYILIIGGEVVLDKTKFLEEEGNVDKFILSALNNSLHANFHTLDALVESRPKYSTENNPNGADMIRNLVLPIEDNGTLDHFLDLEDLAPELVDLLHSQMFRFVMTTTIDDCVEQLMRDVWKKQLRVVNVANYTEWMQFQKDLASTIDRSEDTRTVYKYNTPTLIYIFGKAEEDKSRDFVKTENDAIEFIEKWIKTEGAVTKYIQEKRILALGCKFDDWYFRFFWYIFRRDFERLGEGEVAISLDDHIATEHSLKKYLERKSIFIHPDARQFMAYINKLFVPEADSVQAHELHEIMVHRRGCGEIFLSYSNHDFALACRLFLQLTEVGFQVWFDHESLCGGNYESTIAEAINKASVVLTLLTPNIASDLEKGAVDHYYNKEWRLAAQVDKERIIPVAANGYSLYCDYHTKTYENIAGKQNGVDLMNDGLEKLVKTIENVRNKH